MKTILQCAACAGLAALALVGCSSPQPPVPEPTSLVSQRLTELADSAESFSGIAVGKAELTAKTAGPGGTKHWNLLDGVGPATETNSRVAAVPFTEIDGKTMQDQLLGLASRCETTQFRATIDVLTPQTLLAETRCGEESFEGLVSAAPLTSLINGQALPILTGLPTESTWQAVLQLLAELDPEQRIGSLELKPDVLSLRLADQVATNGCRPALIFERDGSDLTNSCRRIRQEPNISLAALSASDIVKLQTAAMAKADIVASADVSVTIDTDPQVGPQLSVRLRSSQASVPLS